MSITSPPRSPRPHGLVDRAELEALVEALIEEARRRARRRRRRNGACVLLAVLAGVGFYVGLDHVGGGTTGAGTAAAGNAAVAAQSGGGRWGPARGPEGGPGNTVAVAPSAPKTVYLGTRRGVFLSTNGGHSWTSAGLVQPASTSGSPVTGVTSLLVDPRRPNTVYAGLSSPWDGGKWSGVTTYHRAVFKTTDGGKTWRALDLIGQPVAISPTGPPTLYAAAGGPGGKSRLLRSTDGGRSWRRADSGLPSTYPWALALDPTTPATLYAAMGQHGIFESSDGGARWRAVPVSLSYGEVTAIAVDPHQPQTLYAGTDNGTIKSLDGGRSWRMTNAAMGGHNRDRGYMQVTALLVDPRDSRTVYASTGCAGVFKSTDGGHRWASANAGLRPQCSWSYALALDPRAPQIIYAADQVRGALKSLDGGARWQTTNKGLSLTAVSSLAVDPQSPQTVYASAGPLGLFKSSDGGARWRPLASGPHSVDGVALDPSNPRNIIAVATGYGLARSTDGGRTWTETTFGRGVQRHPTVVAISGTTAYAGTYGHGLYGSTDGGGSWHALGPPGVVYVQAIAISPTDPAVVYASVSGSQARGLYKSTDSGSSWQPLTDTLDIDVSTVALNPKNPTTVYIGTAGGEKGVLRSTDGGTTWQPTNSGLPQQRVKTPTGKWVRVNFDVTALAIDPAHPGTLYAASAWRGVFRSTDSGSSWHPFNTGLTNHNVRALALDAAGRTLYAGTARGGVVSLRRNP